MIASEPPNLMDRVEARVATYPEWLQGILYYIGTLIFIMSPLYLPALILFIVWLVR
jgi:hypothetical protein